MVTRFDYMKNIQRAMRPERPADHETIEQLMVLCLVTAAMAHRRVPFSSEVVETIANKMLRRMETLLTGGP